MDNKETEFMIDKGHRGLSGHILLLSIMKSSCCCTTYITDILILLVLSIQRENDGFYSLGSAMFTRYYKIRHRIIATTRRIH